MLVAGAIGQSHTSLRAVPGGGPGRFPPTASGPLDGNAWNPSRAGRVASPALKPLSAFPLCPALQQSYATRIRACQSQTAPDRRAIRINYIDHIGVFS
jgi:hypothetical protein